MEYTESKSSKKLIIFEIACVLIMIGLIGYTYSYFNISVTNNTAITGKAASLSLTLNVSKVAPSNTNGLIPQLDEYITSAVIGRNGSCIDDNNNNVCQVYKITVKNTSTVSLYANGTVTLNANNNPNLKWAQISGTTDPTLVSSVNTYSTIKLVENELFTASEEKIYYIVVWISETGEAQYDTGSFTGTVTFGDANTLPAEATLTNLGLTLTETESELTTFTTTSKLDGSTGIYEAEDDLGTSYYFRGNITNNYVKFGSYSEDAYQVITQDSDTGVYTYSYATSCPETYYSCNQIASAGDNMYWRIVRINGDGSIRMVYDGISAFANGDTTKTINNNSVGTAVYNLNYNDNAYVGYMYGTAGSTTYAETHTNTNESDLKRATDAWYAKYLNSYSGSIVDSIYCNDREVATNETWLSQLSATTDGFGTSVTIYGFYDRVDPTTQAVTPTLKCNQENDKFTVNEDIGNGELTYPVGALTIDEVVFSGSYLYMDETYVNDESYLYNNSFAYWTMSPVGFYGGFARAFVVGDGAFGVDFVYDSGGVRPVITLSSSAITGGTGISTDPFVISSSSNK